MKKYVVASFLFILYLPLFGQPQINNWFFARGHGLNFSTGSPTYLGGGQVRVMEGCSAISDRNGLLLFYTDGIHVWNKLHQIMPNGSGLEGGYGSSTQSSIIVPKTADGLEYYVFTADEEGGPWGLKYSIVNMGLNGGNGDVTVKNSPLVTPVSEKLAAVRQCNKKGYWIICHKFGSDAYYAYSATDTGVNPNPVITHIGSFIPIAYYTMAGCLKSSPDGKKLAAGNFTLGLELFDFDNRTGIISNGTTIFGGTNPLPYGVEFSANSSLLYSSVAYWDSVDLKWYSGVFQFDVSLPNRTDVINSKIQLSRNEQNQDELGTLTRGPDDKIYMAHYRKAYLSLINFPGVRGLGCNFVDRGILLPDDGLFSLPNFPNDYEVQVDSFAVANTGLCPSAPISFNYNQRSDVLSLRWDFDDPASGASNFSFIPNPTHAFTSSGVYNVKLIKYGSCGNDTLTKSLTIGDAVVVDLGNDTSFCEQSSILLDSHSPGSYRYVWNTGATTPTYTASVPGQYWVKVSSNSTGCSKIDTINIVSRPLPIVRLGKDTSICAGDSMSLDARNPGSQYLWSNNSTQQTISIHNSGMYWVEVTINGCKARDTAIVSPLKKPSFSLGPDQFFCPEKPVQLSVGIGNATYQWQDGSTGSTFIVRKAGIYFVDIINVCGTTRDSVIMIQTDCNFYVPNAFSPDMDGHNDEFKVLGSKPIADFEMKIYNRWGNIVFLSKNKDAGWNGKFKGLEQSSGAYVYVISYMDSNSKIKTVLRGTVTLIR